MRVGGSRDSNKCVVVEISGSSHEYNRSKNGTRDCEEEMIMRDYRSFARTHFLEFSKSRREKKKKVKATKRISPLEDFRLKTAGTRGSMKRQFLLRENDIEGKASYV